jgi:hypothetical protein
MSPGTFLAIAAAEKARLRAMRLCDNLQHRLAENQLLIAMNRTRVAEIKLFLAECPPKITLRSEVNLLLPM